MLLLFLFSSSLVSEVCKNYDVSMFQPRKETPTELGYVAYCYIAMIISPAPTFLPATRCPTGGGYLLMNLPSIPYQPSSPHT